MKHQDKVAKKKLMGVYKQCIVSTEFNHNTYRFRSDLKSKIAEIKQSL